MPIKAAIEPVQSAHLNAKVDNAAALPESQKLLD